MHSRERLLVTYTTYINITTWGIPRSVGWSVEEARRRWLKPVPTWRQFAAFPSSSVARSWNHPAKSCHRTPGCLHNEPAKEFFHRYAQKTNKTSTSCVYDHERTVTDSICFTRVIDGITLYFNFIQLRSQTFNAVIA